MLLVKRNKNNGLPTMESFVNDFFGRDWLNDSLFTTNKVEKVNIAEDENSYGIELAIPGFKKEDVKIELNDGLLTISSDIENKNKNEDEKDNYIRKEYHKSSFSRSFYVPDDVDTDTIEASMENGLLSVTLNKIKELEDKTNIKRIDIK